MCSESNDSPYRGGRTSIPIHRDTCVKMALKHGAWMVEKWVLNPFIIHVISDTVRETSLYSYLNDTLDVKVCDYVQDGSK